jgi:hypothetical protein
MVVPLLVAPYQQQHQQRQRTQQRLAQTCLKSAFCTPLPEHTHTHWLPKCSQCAAAPICNSMAGWQQHLPQRRRLHDASGSAQQAPA